MGEGKPGWWRRNERDRAAMDLPPYEPPRFEDGSYVHEVVSALEAEHGCTVTFLGMNVRYPDDWGVRVDGERAFTVERSRNENGNTVYHVDAPTFRERVERAVT
ncbi:hypothetical protein ACFQE1_09430 [Halobium palmae]|uniref:Uncharacterized protein n=1 Tax=Halobium palmae TaxID=1776492 RepID=A0ABD5RZ72_9EURY